MLRVYFDDELIDVEAYTELDNEYKLFTDTFKLGSVASNTFKLSVIKSAVSEQPNEVRIEDDNTTWNFIVDNIVKDDNFYAYTLTDKLVDFNFDYDASVLINSKAELEEDCYLSDIWKDMCNQANVEYDETYVFENDIVVTWYDNRIQARRYLSFIAELQSGYAYIMEDGKQSFKKQKRSSVKTIDADECSDLIVGEKKTITRVVYDGGAFKWEFGDETGDTLYLQSDNVFIVNEDIVENIYNNIKDFEFYIINCPQAPMDSTIKAGDVITFNDNGKLYPTIAQYSMSYAGSWSGGYKLQVNTERQQETQITRTSQQVRNIQTKVDRLNNEFSIVVEQIDEQETQIATITQTVEGQSIEIEKISDLEERTTTVETNIDGINVKMQKIGGTNLIINSARHYTNGWGVNIFPGVSNTEIKQNTVSKNAFYVGDGINSQEIQVQNGIYTIGWKYKKLINLANVKLKINAEEVILDKNEWTSGVYTFEVFSNTIKIEIIGDTENCGYLSDLMCNFGSIAQVWSSAQGESVYGKTKMGEMFEAESETESKRTTVGADGLRGYNTTTNEVVFETTTYGSKGEHLEFKSSNISGVVRQRVGNQVWDTFLG